MRAHPDFADRAIPEFVELGPYRLTRLGMADLDEDFAAVTESAGILEGLFGDDWPRGLTREDDLLDLAWHEREFSLGRSFAWVIRDSAGAYLGCAYVFPPWDPTAPLEAYCWLRSGAEGHADEATANFGHWLSAPPGRRGAACA
mgnify:CR=1 FL=1